MKTIAICRYAPHEGPGYFATYLSARSIGWSLIKLDEGDILPSVNEITGLAMMGGPMSANDDLPWLPGMLALIRGCVTHDVPVIGHCLGGQLLAKALGASITRNPVKEIGWGGVEVRDTPVAQAWSRCKSFLGFHWHGETFSIPTGAELMWSSAHCANQAFALGKHIGMQCHVETTQDMIDIWCETGASEIERDVSRSPAVQTQEVMQRQVNARLDALRIVADHVYDRWASGLQREVSVKLSL
jgi:GMP synthase-like glutamine amidotransferase